MSSIIIAISTMFILAWLPISTSACSCIGESTVKKEFRKSDVVISGKILSQNIFVVKDKVIPVGLVYRQAEYSVLVTKIYKGRILGDTLRIVTTGITSGDCGIRLKPELEYIIYCTYSDRYFENGEKRDIFLYTDMCTRTQLFNTEEDSALLKIIKQRKSKYLRRKH